MIPSFIARRSLSTARAGIETLHFPATSPDPNPCRLRIHSVFTTDQRLRVPPNEKDRLARPRRHQRRPAPGLVSGVPDRRFAPRTHPLAPLVERLLEAHVAGWAVKDSNLQP